jgi:hypothetical protein
MTSDDQFATRRLLAPGSVVVAMNPGATLVV